MKTITELLLPHAERMDEYFVQGVTDRFTKRGDWAFRKWLAKHAWRDYRATYGFERLFTPLLTPPSANLKLNKATRPSYGLTLQHYVQKIRPRLTVNACPWAGDCTKVCVLDNGNGKYEAVQRARRAKTAFLVDAPTVFSYLLGWELTGATLKHGPILFRPNVNSDLEWEKLLPSLVDGSMLPGVASYGYSKNPEVLKTDGWLGKHYRVAYSWSEKSDPDDVEEFIRGGGSMAVVTDRRKGDPPPTFLKLGKRWECHHNPETGPRILDADLTDEWIFQHGVIGDLSAKGKARSLQSDFIVRR